MGFPCAKRAMNLNCFLTLVVALTHALVCVTQMLIFSFAAHAIADQMQVTWVASQTCLPATNAGYLLFVHEAPVRRCTRRFIFRVNEDALVVSKKSSEKRRTVSTLRVK